MHIVELHKLLKARNERETIPVPVTNYRIRTAAIQNANTLLKSGMFTPNEISHHLQIPITDVYAEMARMQERNEARNKYVNSLRIEGEG